MLFRKYSLELNEGLHDEAERRPAAAGARRAGKRNKPEEPERDIIFEEKQVVAEDRPKRYADASDDHNPIHVAGSGEGNYEWAGGGCGTLRFAG